MPEGRRTRRKGSGAGIGVARAASHFGLVVALWAVMVACALSAGVSALLVTAGNDRALAAAVSEADGTAASGGVDVATVLISAATGDDVAAPHATEVLPLTTTTLLDAASPYPATVSTWATTPLLFLPADEIRRGYLLGADADASTSADGDADVAASSVQANASLVSGRWPVPPQHASDAIEVAVPTTVASHLGVDIGTRLRLSERREHADAQSPGYDLVIVGVFEPSATRTWDRDLLRGAGYNPNLDWLPAYGPFVVAPGTLVARDVPVARVSAVLDPNVAGDARGIPGLVGRMFGVASTLEDRLEPGSRAVVRTDLGDAFADMRAELSLTNSMVMSVFLHVVVLGMASVALVSRVLSRRRAGEVSLLSARGASSWQRARPAAAEAFVLAVAATAVALPLSLVAYREFASSLPWSESWASAAGASSTVSPWWVLAVVAGAAVPAVVVVATSVLAPASHGRTSTAGPVVTAGIDIMLVLVAAVMYVQLRGHAATAGAIDPILVIAPAICAVALASLVARFLPVVGRAANTAARSARGTVISLASWHVARGGATHGIFLVVLATAVGMFGVTFVGTWSASQEDQAEAMVGADMVVSDAATPGVGARLTAITGGEAVPVADSAVVFGTRPEGVRLVALDTASADAVVRGDLPDGATWKAAMEGLAPEDPDAVLALGQGSLTVTVVGTPRGLTAQRATPPVVVTPRFVLRNQWGEIATVNAEQAPLDDAPHVMVVPQPRTWDEEKSDWSVVAIELLVSEPASAESATLSSSKISASVSIQVSGATSNGGEWGAASPSSITTISPGEVTVTGSTVEASFSYSPLELSWQGAHLVLTGFPPSTQVPVMMSEQLAEGLGMGPGDHVAMVKGTTTLDAVLVRTVPYVPSRVRGDAVLADLTSLHRALLSADSIGPLTDRWWVNVPDQNAVNAVRAEGLGTVTTSYETATALRDGPVRVSLSIAWRVAVVAAVVLAAAGAATLAAGEAQQRVPTAAKLRAIGLPKRDVLASHLLQHAAVTVSAVACGVGAGALLALLLAPRLVVGPGGQSAVPPASLVWSVGSLAAVAMTIAVSGVLAGLPAAFAMVRRSTVAALRSGDAW